jgi:CRP-like cAMP-binding protein
MVQSSSPHERLIRKLESITRLGPEETNALRRLPLTTAKVEEDADVAREGDRPSQCCLLVDGFLFRYKMLPEGQRQIMSLHVPGDLPDLQSLYLKVMDHSVGALAPSTVAYIPHPAVLELVQRYPRITAAFWRDTLVDAAIFREWITNCGRRSAYQRAAHLMCEFFTKMKAVGLTRGDSCDFPITQAELADAMGLSPVHVNRTLQELRADGLVALSGRSLSIPDWEALKLAGQFDPTYLHLVRKDAA